MATLKVYEARELTDQWGELEQKIEKINKRAKAKLEPILARHEEELAAATKREDREIKKLRDAQGDIEAQVLPWLTGRKRDTVVEGEIAEAVHEIRKSLGARVLPFNKFWTATRGLAKEDISRCINVMIGEAEKLLGKAKVDKLADRAPIETPVNVLRLKPVEEVVGGQ
ncbi:MAG: hypothetical protein ABL959_09940 [Pyrinomonadaceae bacterium]